MPEVQQAYDNSNSDKNVIAWHNGTPNGPYNAGVNVSSYSTQKEVLSKDTSVEAVFKGGFAGKCESDQVWQKTQDTENTWRCSGEIPWQQTVYLPEFENDDHVGLIFPPYNFINDQTNLPDYVYNFVDGKQEGAGFNSFEVAAEQMDFLFSGSTDIDRINARCWNGTTGIPEGQMSNSQSYLESNYNVKMSDFQISVPSNPSDPVANFRPLDHDGSYSCYWNVTTADGDTVSDIQDTMVEVHNHLGKTPSGKESILVKNITEDSSYAGDLPDMTGSNHEWTTSELTTKIGSWN